MKVYLIVVLICTSLIISEIKHIFIFLLTTPMPSMEEYLLNSFAIFE